MYIIKYALPSTHVHYQFALPPTHVHYQFTRPPTYVHYQYARPPAYVHYQIRSLISVRSSLNSCSGNARILSTMG